ncbi:hypothetical protein M6B38_404360 [Iris pallida]|uniref:Uncharacterized protein n=1 Tax=Iris pallida TaxID=29817 RepID=A0AAX6FSF4_IRIPA|nr:hypothetical protein M6B38_404360 [Iris pallida]
MASSAATERHHVHGCPRGRHRHRGDLQQCSTTLVQPNRGKYTDSTCTLYFCLTFLCLVLISDTRYTRLSCTLFILVSHCYCGD